MIMSSSAELIKDKGQLSLRKVALLFKQSVTAENYFEFSLSTLRQLM